MCADYISICYPYKYEDAVKSYIVCEAALIVEYMKINTYIHNWPLQPFNQDYGLASHTTHVVCINFIRDLRDLQFNVDSELQIF